ncbi:metal ABC transporter ATP-binding protein [Candidatus Dependentiae bacterium]|nr:metal ABC transporter ATP-binding protein [Candidatus Dependentiae bacterium]
MTAALEVDHLTVAYKDTVILHDLCARIPQGVVAALIGPNGAGKTTFLKSILSIVQPRAGTVKFLGTPYNTIRNQVAYIPQRSSIDWDFPACARDVAIMGRYGSLGWFKRPGKTDWAQADQSLELVGLSNYAARPIQELSGGQQQRLFLARALAQEAQIYLLDEPFAGIDAHSEKMIISLLHTMRDQGKTIIIVHHDLNTLSYFDWALLINKKAVACGPVSQAITPTTLAQTYGLVVPC